MTYQPAQPVTPIEDVNRGTLFALGALPLGVVAWVLLGTIGFIASIVTYGVAYAALFLYLRGSGGTISRPGAIRVTIITLGTAAVSILAGLVATVAIAFGRVAHMSPFEALGHPRFGDLLTTYLTEGVSDYLPSVLIGIAFAVLGCFSLLRGAFRATAPINPNAPAQQLPPTPGTPPAA